MNLTDLLKRKMALSLMQNIPDMFQYAIEWAQLAAEFEAIDLPYNAEDCRTRGLHYLELSGGEYIRLFDMPFAELIEVPA